MAAISQSTYCKEISIHIVYLWDKVIFLVWARGHELVPFGFEAALSGCSREALRSTTRVSEGVSDGEHQEL